MAIVEGKSGMQIGNMPSIDAVTQDGFIIYSDDGIHTYKMTIAEFAQAIGVVMTGGGDGDGGDGLAYWKEESKRIFRDLMSSNENEFRVIRLNVLGGIESTFRTCVKHQWEMSNDSGETYADFGVQLVIPKYGNNNMFPNTLFHDVLKTFRFPALDELLTMPDSRYYCNYSNPAQRAITPYSQVPSEMNYEDITVNPDYYITGPTYAPGSSEPVGTYEGYIPRVNATGQDRRFFGYINLNVNKTVKMHNLKIDYQHGYGIGEITADSAANLDLVMENKKREAQLVEDDYPVTGTAEYIFNLYCMGCPSEKVKASYTSGQDLKEFEYYPWSLQKPTNINPTNLRMPFHFNDNFNHTIDLSELEEQYIPPETALGRDMVAIKDKKSNTVLASPYTYPLVNKNPESTPSGTPYDTMYDYYDKSDIGGAYFEDSDGTQWYVVLTPRTRASKSYWDQRNNVAPSVITTDPSDFDKAPQYLALDQVYDHWCYNGDDDIDNYDLWDGGWNGTPWSTEEGGVTTWHRLYGPYRYSLKSEKMAVYNENLQTIGKAILNALGLRGIKPLELEAGGIHSEISATVDTVLNGGRYLVNGDYEQTYNLNGAEGSLYLKGDCYDNGEKLKEAYQKKLTPGEGIEIEMDQETGDLVISSNGGGGGGNISASYDSTNKSTTISGFGEKSIVFQNGGGAYVEYIGNSGNSLLMKTVLAEVVPGSDVLWSIATSPQAYRNMVKLEINSDYHNSTQRRIKGGKHVWLNSIAETEGNTPNKSYPNARDVLSTDCIDTINVNGTPATVNYDINTGSHYVNLTVPGAGVSPFTVDIGGNYGGNGYIETGFSSFTKIGHIYLQPNNNYCWIEVEVAMYVNSTDSIAADSVITMELRPYGFSGDICDPPGSLSNRSLQLTDSKHIIHSADGPVWNKISVSGLVNYSGSEALRLDVNVKQNSGINKYVKWKAGVAYVPVSS